MQKVSFISRLKTKISHLWHLGDSRALVSGTGMAPSFHLPLFVERKYCPKAVSFPNYLNYRHYLLVWSLGLPHSYVIEQCQVSTLQTWKEMPNPR